MDEYITVKYRVSTIKRQRRFNKLILFPLSLAITIFSLILLTFGQAAGADWEGSLFLTFIGVIGISYAVWNHFYWRKLLKEKG